MFFGRQGFGMQINGLEKLHDKTSKDNIKKSSLGGMQLAVDAVRKAVKRNTPVRSGVLRASWQSEARPDSGRVYTGVRYGPYINYGTGVFVGRGRIYPKSARVLAWDGVRVRSIKGVEGRHFVEKTIKEEQPNLSKYFAEAFDHGFGGEENAGNN
ncbi:MAG: HK97 gp10 family phage protein [Candidatus Odinarchaeota archaeon]